MIFFIIMTLIYLLIIFYVHKSLLDYQKENNYIDNDNKDTKENDSLEINDEELVDKKKLEEFIKNI